MEKIIDKLLYDKLVISGGGSKGYIMLGSLHYSHELGLINNIKEYWGVSVGSLIATFLIIGISPMDIFFILYEQGLIGIGDADLTLDSLFSRLGLYPIETFGNKIRLLINKYYGKVPTFLEFYTKTGKSLNIIGTNIDEMKSEIFNYKNSPNMSIIDALEISCDIPYIFTKKIYNGINYMDGGFVNEFPIDEADSGDKKILGIWIKSCNSTGNSYFDNIYRPMIATLTELQRLRMKGLSKKCDIITIDSPLLGFTDLNPDRKTKIEMFSNGYKKTEEFFTNKFMNGWDLELEI